jgi:hypothetical protein
MREFKDPYCAGCGKAPHELSEYLDAVRGTGLTPAGYVRKEEGTYNPENGRFLCTSCYCDAGMPSSPEGWVCP